MTDIVQIIIQIQQKQPEIKNLKGLTKFIYENLNPRNFSGTCRCCKYHGVLGTEILDFLNMYGLNQEESKKLFGHLVNQGFIYYTGVTGVYESNIQD